MAFVTTVRIPVAGPYPSGVKINNGAGYAAGTTAAATVDDIYTAAGDARDIFFVGQQIFAVNTAKVSNPIELLGNCTAVIAAAVTCNDGTGFRFAVADNAELYTLNAGALSLAKARATNLAVTGAATCGLEVTEDGRGNLLFTYFDIS